MSKFEDALRAFEAVQKQYREFGAWDTEPCSVFYSLLESVYRGQEPAIPDTPTGWQLFSDMPGAVRAAKALARAARVAVRAANADAIRLARWVSYA